MVCSCWLQGGRDTVQLLSPTCPSMHANCRFIYIIIYIAEHPELWPFLTLCQSQFFTPLRLSSTLPSLAVKYFCMSAPCSAFSSSRESVQTEDWLSMDDRTVSLSHFCTSDSDECTFSFWILPSHATSYRAHGEKTEIEFKNGSHVFVF